MHINEYFEMVFGDAIYVVTDICILRRMVRTKVPPGANLHTIDALNKMHASFKNRVGM